MGAILNLFSLLKMLLELWNAFQAHEAAVKEVEDKKKLEAAKQAVDAATKAKTPEDAYAAQDSIVSNEP